MYCWKYFNSPSTKTLIVKVGNSNSLKIFRTPASKEFVFEFLTFENLPDFLNNFGNKGRIISFFVSVPNA